MEALNRATAAKDLAAASAAAAATAAGPASDTFSHTPHQASSSPARHVEPASPTSTQAPMFGVPALGHTSSVRGTLAHSTSANASSTSSSTSTWSQAAGNKHHPRDGANHNSSPSSQAPTNGSSLLGPHPPLNSHNKSAPNNILSHHTHSSPPASGAGAAFAESGSLTDAFAAFLRSGEDDPAGDGKAHSAAAAARHVQPAAQSNHAPSLKPGTAYNTAASQPSGTGNGWPGARHESGTVGVEGGNLGANGLSSQHAAVAGVDPGSQAMLTRVEAGGSSQPKGIGAGTGKVLRGLARYVAGNVQPQVTTTASVQSIAQQAASRTQQTAAVQDAG